MAPSVASNHHRVLVVGAGFNGIAAAKIYLEIDPLVDILLIDGESSIGGVWSASRIYPGLQYEMPAPMLDFPDMSMCKELGIEEWSDVDGDQVNDYLMRYATKYGIPERCRLGTEVVSIDRNGSGWKVFVRPTGNGKASVEVITCDKLIVCTGITSKPRPIDFDLGSFDGISFHAIEMGKRHTELVTNEIKNVIVVGGHKSALEVVGTCAQAGKNVEWLIREHGGGPTWLMPPRNPDGTAASKMSTKRAISFFSTSVYHSDRWLNRFLHSGRWRVGSYFIARIWNYMTKMMQGDKYSKSENGKKLKPHPENMFWFVPGGTIAHDRDLQTLRLVDEEKLIHVNRAHMISAKGRSVTLSTGETVLADAIVFCTGWQLSAPPLFSSSLCYELGLPTDPTVIPDDEKKHWSALDTVAENNIDQLYPILKNPPRLHMPTDTASPFRLFRSLIPSKLAARGDNSIVFLGNYANGRVQLSAEIYSLWGIAYLEGLLPESTKATLADATAMEKDIAHIEAYRRKRYLNAFPFRLSIFESSEYDDRLMLDLGLRADRKRMRMPSGWRDWFGWKSWKAEWTESYLAKDYEGLVQEFLHSVKERGGEVTGVNAAPKVNGIKKD